MKRKDPPELACKKHLRDLRAFEQPPADEPVATRPVLKRILPPAASSGATSPALLISEA